MKIYQWPYSRLDKEEFLERIIYVEKILQKYGAKYVGEFCEMCSWVLSDGIQAYEKIEKHIWKINNVYIRVDRVYFLEKPFLVLEFSKCKEGPYEDADPFPYDLSDIKIEQEIRYSLGIKSL